MSREKLFSVTAADCEWQYYRSSGAGGQKRNKTSSAARCTHRASKARGQSSEHRGQRQNRIAAFSAMFHTDEFQQWLKVEAARCSGALSSAQKQADEAMAPKNIRTEVKDDEGKWVVV
jgi:protein subunit release factor B